MNAEIIAIGDELVSGQRLDTNSQWLSEQLGQLGIRVLFHTTVGDDLPANVRVLREAYGRADVVVCTGGLGPTADDLTRDALAQSVDVDLVRDDEVLAGIRELFARRQREMPERNVVQAMFPRGAHCLPNPHGTAPGILMEVPREGSEVARVFALPGVAAEMRQMWSESVIPALLAAQGDRRRVIRHQSIKCFGAGESQIEQMLPDLIQRGREPAVGITASKATITLRVSAAAASPEHCEQAMRPTLDTIRECLGSLVFGNEDDELQHSVARILTARQTTLATAEWGTDGLLAHWLAELPNSETFFRGGLVHAPHPQLPDMNVRESLAGLDNAALAEETMKHIAASLRQQFGADLGLAASDFPPPPSSDKVPPTFMMALASASGVEVGAAPYTAHPDLLAELSAKRALDFVRLAVPAM